jgi:chemotaxis protein histidine kinase CheA
MPADSGRMTLAELLASARVAILALAPQEHPDAAPEPISAEACARASSAIAGLSAELENADDTLRTLLAVDMALAVDSALSASASSRGKLVAILVQALSALGDVAPTDGGAGPLPSCSPLVLANELRALRGAPLLSGNAVFAIAVDAGATAASGDEPRDVDPRLAASARRLRSYYQQGLIAWLAGDSRGPAGAARIGEVFARLHVLAQGTEQESLWRAAASFANLLGDSRWRMSTAIKRLLGQLDGQLKRLGDQDAMALDVVPRGAPSLEQDLLFNGGEPHDVDATIGVFPSRSALLAAFAVPSRAHPDQPTAVLSLLNELLAIAAQLMEALAPDESWLTKRSWLVDRLLHVSDGLGLLGAHDLRHRAMDEIGLLRKTPASGDPPPGGWGRVAERLHALGAELLTVAGMKPTAAVAEDTAGMPSSGYIARRLEADLVHAEGLIQRLEQGRGSLPAEPVEPSAPSAEDEDEDEDGGAARLRRRLDEFAGAVRAQPRPGSGDTAFDGLAPSSSDELPAALADHELVDDVARFAGEIDGSRTRLEQQVGALREGLRDMDNGIRALREEFDGLRLHTEALRVAHDPADPGQMPSSAGRGPPVTDLRQRLDALASRVSALSQLRDSIDTIAGDSRSVLVQQARDNVALEQRLMQNRLQPLDAQLQRLAGEVAEGAANAGKQVLLRVDPGGLRIEPEKMAALLPVLRSLTSSMIEAGVEPPRARVLGGRPPGCLMDMRFKRRGADLNMVLTADCKPPAAAAVAEAQAFLRPLGGLLELDPDGGSSTRCSLQMPLAPRVSTVLLVAVGGEILALPLAEVSAVLQLSAEELENARGDGIEHLEQRWRLAHLSTLLALGGDSPPGPVSRLPLVLVASGDGHHALVVDAIGERVDVVVRSVAPQLRSVAGLAGAAILGDGQVVLLLDVGPLMESRPEAAASSVEAVS